MLRVVSRCKKCRILRPCVLSHLYIFWRQQHASRLGLSRTKPRCASCRSIPFTHTHTKNQNVGAVKPHLSLTAPSRWSHLHLFFFFSSFIISSPTPPASMQNLYFFFSLNPRRSSDSVLCFWTLFLSRASTRHGGVWSAYSGFLDTGHFCTHTHTCARVHVWQRANRRRSCDCLEGRSQNQRADYLRADILLPQLTLFGVKDALFHRCAVGDRWRLQVLRCKDRVAHRWGF